jgi:hypothetical protein
MSNIMHPVTEDILYAAGMGRVDFTGGVYVHGSPTVVAKTPLRAIDGPNLTSATESRFPGSGRNKLITSWLYGYTELTSRLKSALKSSLDADSLVWQDMTSGPGVMRPPYIRGGENAVNPG